MALSSTYIVAGIDTNAGKTVVSAILAERLQADYWKPVQAGDLDDTDTDKVRRWVSNPRTVCHPEAYRLRTPMSPHGAAALDGIRIEASGLALPATRNRLLIELAGGLMVPLRPDFLIIDWLEQLGLPVVLVSRYYLGSINHTLLSIDALRRRGIPLAGIIFNGEEVPTTREVVLAHAQAPCWGSIGMDQPPSPEMVRDWAGRLALPA
jgi:dethiobiotin synthetase